MRKLTKISQHGNSATITLPRALLSHLRWSTGHYVILELTERRTIEVRPPTEADISALQAPPRLPEPAQGELV